MRRRVRVTIPVLVTATIYATVCLKNNFGGFPPVETTTPVAAATARSLAPMRRVTKSLAELGKMDEIGSHVLLLNRVPKSGGEVVVFLLQWLQGWNSFRHVRLKGGGGGEMSRLEQERFVYEVSDHVRNFAVPLTFDRQVRFVNFSNFDRQSPTYVNLIRDPAECVVSRFRSKHMRSFESKKVMEAFKKCLIMKKQECYLQTGNKYDLTIPYFCGHDQRCSVLNDEWALNTAKSNAERYFKVVGVLEEFNATLDAFERHLPQFFNGAKDLYRRDLLESYKSGNKKRIHLSEDVRSYLKSDLVKEYEFYEWAKMRLFQQLKAGT